MKKDSWIAIVLLIVLAVLTITAIVLFATRDNRNSGVVDAVWWWDNRLDESYLDFAHDKGVKEIYLYASSFSEKISDFLVRADALGMQVYWLTGEYQWIHDSAPLLEQLDAFRRFQQTAPVPFAGVHLDIEPHQDPNFEQNRVACITALIALADTLQNKYPDLHIAYDIPIWLHDMITYQGVTKPAYAHMIDRASRITLMSYRDSCEEIYRYAEDEIRYAVQAGKPLDLGVETQPNDDDIVTFYEEGAGYMYRELASLREKLPSDFGIVIHHIKSWRELRG